jgi:transglutaminase-like putative cysteine protease
LPQKGLSVDAVKKRNDLRSNLLADAQTPVNDPTIQAKAKEIVGSEQDVWQRALKIHEFVFRYLVKEPTISMPNALQVLKSGRGDCNEHAALYTALARAAGVPTRTVVGLVYSDHFYGDAGFYYHAWVEVNTGSSWVALDPTWNQIPADATHIAFVDGGLDKQLQITSLMGKVKLQPS